MANGDLAWALFAGTLVVALVILVGKASQVQAGLIALLQSMNRAAETSYLAQATPDLAKIRAAEELEKALADRRRFVRDLSQRNQARVNAQNEAARTVVPQANLRMRRYAPMGAIPTPPFAPPKTDTPEAPAPSETK